MTTFLVHSILIWSLEHFSSSTYLLPDSPHLRTHTGSLCILICHRPWVFLQQEELSMSFPCQPSWPCSQPQAFAWHICRHISYICPISRPCPSYSHCWESWSSFHFGKVYFLSPLVPLYWSHLKSPLSLQVIAIAPVASNFHGSLQCLFNHPPYSHLFLLLFYL